jgi:hypothetical protein
MKKIYILLTAVILTASAFAQAPEKMSYQAVIRNAGNALVTSQTVGMQLSILQGSVTGLAVYAETQAPTTNINGLVSIEIGAGTVISGTFNTIDWSAGPYFIKAETDPTGGATYTITGTSQLISVPYALHSNTADSIVGGVSIIETDPVFGASIANGITTLDIADWNNHTVDTDTQLDSTAIANMGFIAGSATLTPTIEYKKLFFGSASNYMVNLSWIQIYTSGVNGELVVTVPATASASARVNYAIDNGAAQGITIAVGNSVTITGLASVRLEISCAEYSNIGPGGVLNWTGIGMANGWQMGHVMYE